MIEVERRRLGFAGFALYALCVVAANWFVQHVGQATPGGPHTIPVGFSYRAPSGVLWVGLAFTVRDLVQTTLGKRATALAILVGAALSYLVAPSLAYASAMAFLLSEALDFVVYTPLVDRDRVVAAVVLSNTAGLLVDTFVFLELAFHSLDFWQGQVVGKALMTLAVLPVVVWMRSRGGGRNPMSERTPAMGGRLAGAYELALTVVSAADVTPSMRRVTLRGDALVGLQYDAGQDLMLSIPSGDGTVRRRYTIRSLDAAAGTVDIDFVLHGHGPAARWATAAAPGDRIDAVGPRGKVAVRVDADWHLFVGDDSAVPATLAMLDAVPAGVPVTAFLEVGGAEDEQPSGDGVWWLHRGDVEPGASTALVDAVADFELPAGQGAVYLNGEKRIVRTIQNALIERGMAKDDIARKAYWVYGEANGDHGEPIPDGGMPGMRRGA